MTHPSRKPADTTSIRHQQMQGFPDLTLCGVRKSEQKKASTIKIATTGHKVSCPKCLKKIGDRKKNNKAHLKKMAKVRKNRKEERDGINFREANENDDYH